MDITISIIAFAGLIGALLSGYLLVRTSQKHRIHCPFKDQCNEVLYSKYSRIFGVQTLAFGVAYYTVVFLSATYALIDPTAMQEIPLKPFLYVAVAAVLVSLYQTAIQIFVLKKWCSWCLESTLLSIIILAAAWSLIA